MRHSFVLIVILWSTCLDQCFSDVTHHGTESVEAQQPPPQQQHQYNSANNETEKVCTDFIELLVDHLFYQRTMQFAEPVLLEPISTSMLDIDQGRLYGLRSVKRTCPIEIEHEEVWQKPNKTMHNHEITIPEWMRKRDRKLADVIHMNFCMGIPKKLKLRGIMKVSTFWRTFDPEHGLISLSNVSVRVKLSLHLNTNGTMNLELKSMRIEKLDDINFEQDEEKIKRSGEEETIDSGFFSNYGSTLTWLANGPIRASLVIVLEGLLNDSFSALIKQKQSS